MKKRQSGVLKIVLSIFVIAFLMICALFLYFFVPSLKVKLDIAKLDDGNVGISIFSAQQNELPVSNLYKNQYVFDNQMPQYLKDAFVCLEDKRFFEHKGIDWYRVAGAIVDNIKSMRLKEGASTITQQLIKNTHLTNEKTFVRKFAEARLALQLEKQMSKQKILEIYLNSIYFGNECYGISSASSFYFDKDVEQLTLSESAILAGMISAPNLYAPNKNAQKCFERRNLALKTMFEQQKITKEQLDVALDEKIDLSKIGLKTDDNKNYADMVICEVADLFGISIQQAKHMNIKVFTFLDEQKQKALAKSVKNQSVKTKNGKNAQKMAISIDNQTCGVQAFFANTNHNPYFLKRQIGSTAKPIVCLAPSFEQNLITPSTLILDEQADFGGYKPTNSSDKYDGWISIRTAIAKSKNVPAVKLLNALDKDQLKNNLAQIWGFDEQNLISLNMALGNFDDGLTISQLTNSYLMLANNGEFENCTFINRIEDENGKVLYQNKSVSKQIFRDDSAFLTTQVLKDVVKYGTARNLNANFDIAGKTGTVGKKGCENNSDGIFCSYTSQDTTVFWVFSEYDDLLESKVTGSSTPVSMAKSFYDEIYGEKKPNNFVQPNSVFKIKVDKVLLNQGKIAMANDFLSTNEVVEEYFSKYNLPKEVSKRNLPTKRRHFENTLFNEFWFDIMKKATQTSGFC